jgi:hypothetical protein
MFILDPVPALEKYPIINKIYYWQLQFLKSCFLLSIHE